MYIFKSDLSCGRADSKYLSQLDNEYNKYKDEPINELSMDAFNEYFRSGNRLIYEKEYFHRRTLLRDFALKLWLGENDAAKRLENVLYAVCEEFTWVLPAHIGADVNGGIIDLFAAETAHTLTEIISLAGDKLSGDVTQRCINEVRERVLDPFITREHKYNWENMTSNWCAVCGGCVGMTALYLIEDEITLKQITDSLAATFEHYLMSFSDDGACLEGLYYWNYGMMYFIAFLDLYRQRMGEEFTVNTEKVIKMADFAHKCCIADGVTVSFSDGYERDRIYLGLSHKLHEMYNSALISDEYLAGFAGDECGRWCKAARDIAWINETEKAAYSLKNTALPMAQWAVLRGDNMSIAFKGGSNGEPHNHNDVGTVIVIKNGGVILCDLGAGEYTAEYFSDNRYNIFCSRSMGHSVPIINGAEQKTGSEYRAYGFFADRNTAGADISGAYGADTLKECVRTVRCLGNEAEIEDKFTLDKETEITERFITRHRAVVENNAVKIFADGKPIGVLVTDKPCDIEVKTYAHHEHDGSISDVTAIDFKFIANGKCNFLVKIL